MEVVTLMALVAAAMLGLALVETVVRRTDVGAGLVLLLYFVEETEIRELSFSAGGFSVFPNDLLFAVLATAAIARLLRVERLTTAQRLMVGLAAVVAWAVYEGVGDHGIAATINESRRYLMFVAAALYFSTMAPRRALLEQVGRMWVYVALGLCGLTLLRWAANAAGLTGGLFGTGGSMRVVPAAAALVIGQAAMMGVPALRERGAGLWKYVTPVMLVFVVLLQHRTVWVVVLSGFTYLVLRERALTPRLLTSMAAGIVIFAVLSLTLFNDAERQLSDQLAVSATNTATFEWRVAGWAALLEDSGPETFTQVLFGQAPGGGWERIFDGRFVDVQPHNYYVENYLRLGVVGLLLTLTVYGLAIRGRPWDEDGEVRDTDRSLPLSRHVLSTIIGVNLLYFITYSPDSMQAMLLGLGCAFLAHPTSSEESGADRFALDAER